MQNKIKPIDLLTDQFQHLKNYSVNDRYTRDNNGSSSQNEMKEQLGTIMVNVSKILRESSAYLGIVSFYEANRMTSSQFQSACRSFTKTLNQICHLELCGNQMEWFLSEKFTSLPQDTKLMVNHLSQSLRQYDPNVSFGMSLHAIEMFEFEK